MAVSPYTPGGRPRVIAYGEMMDPLLAITEPRGVGKTSLLRDVQDRATEAGFVVAWSAGVKYQPFLPDVVDGVVDALRDVPFRAGRGRLRLASSGWRSMLAWPRCLSATLNRQDAAEPERPTHAAPVLRPFQRFLTEAATEYEPR